MSIAEKLTTIAENEQRVYEAGKEKALAEWWGKYCPSTRRNFLYAFAGSGWTDTTYGSIPDDTVIIPTQNAQMMYQYSLITDTKVTIDISAGSTNMGNIFANASSLVTVHKLIVSPNTKMNNNFTSCSKLKNLTIEGTIAKNAYFQWCPLTVETMKHIIGHLKNFSGTGSEQSTTLQFSDTCWEALEADSTAPDGGTWRDYVENVLSWNT